MKLPAKGSLQLEKKACSGMELVPAGAREVLEEIMLGQAGDWSGIDWTELFVQRLFDRVVSAPVDTSSAGLSYCQAQENSQKNGTGGLEKAVFPAGKAGPCMCEGSRHHGSVPLLFGSCICQLPAV